MGMGIYLTLLFATRFQIFSKQHILNFTTPNRRMLGQTEEREGQPATGLLTKSPAPVLPS